MKRRKGKICKIERIENGNLWDDYYRRKIKMELQLSSENIREMDLFHGTDLELCKIIAKQGFDIRLSGNRIGIRFGKGTYFTKKADYAHKYTMDEDGIYKMFLANVLVGESCLGNVTYVRPPLKDENDPGGGLYNSCVDDTDDPNVFIIFSNDQIYPAYIISYEIEE